MTEGKAGFHSSHTWQSGLKDGKLEPSTPAAQPPKCPECGSQRVWRYGLRYPRSNGNGPIQRWLCRSCGYRFSRWNGSEASEHVGRIHRQILNCAAAYPVNRQICVSQTKAMLNLDSATETKTVAGESEKLPQDAKGLIVKYMAYLERQGYYQDTSYLILIRVLAKEGDLRDPESIKTAIARHKWKNSSKMLASYAYGHFCKMENITWTPPKYRQEETVLYVPDERDLDALINSTQSKRMAAFLQCLKETYADPGEILRLQWREIKDNIITINHPVKGHLPGQMQVSNRLISMLNALPQNSILVFPTSYRNIHKSLQSLRKKTALKLQNPRLLEINFKSFRHWGGSMLAHYTNGNILTIKKMLRHKQVANTMKYIHTIQFKDEDFEIATATTTEEIKQLGQAGFVKYDEMSGMHFYRKPKKFGGLQ